MKGEYIITNAHSYITCPLVSRTLNVSLNIQLSYLLSSTRALFMFNVARVLYMYLNLHRIVSLIDFS